MLQCVLQCVLQRVLQLVILSYPASDFDSLCARANATRANANLCVCLYECEHACLCARASVRAC